MTLSDALSFASSHKHKLALACLGRSGYIMDVRALGRNTAYKLCRDQGFSFNRQYGFWMKG